MILLDKSWSEHCDSRHYSGGADDVALSEEGLFICLLGLSFVLMQRPAQITQLGDSQDSLLLLQAIDRAELDHKTTEKMRGKIINKRDNDMHKASFVIVFGMKRQVRSSVSISNNVIGRSMSSRTCMKRIFQSIASQLVSFIDCAGALMGVQNHAEESMSESISLYSPCPGTRGSVAQLNQ